jgi:type II secretory pathway component PulF
MKTSLTHFLHNIFKCRMGFVVILIFLSRFIIVFTYKYSKSMKSMIEYILLKLNFIKSLLLKTEYIIKKE